MNIIYQHFVFSKYQINQDSDYTIVASSQNIDSENAKKIHREFAGCLSNFDRQPITIINITNTQVTFVRSQLAPQPNSRSKFLIFDYCIFQLNEELELNKVAILHEQLPDINTYGEFKPLSKEIHIDFSSFTKIKDKAYELLLNKSYANYIYSTYYQQSKSIKYFYHQNNTIFLQLLFSGLLKIPDETNIYLNNAILGIHCEKICQIGIITNRDITQQELEKYGEYKFQGQFTKVKLSQLWIEKSITVQQIEDLSKIQHYGYQEFVGALLDKNILTPDQLPLQTLRNLETLNANTFKYALKYHISEFSKEDISVLEKLITKEEYSHIALQELKTIVENLNQENTSSFCDFLLLWVINSPSMKKPKYDVLVQTCYQLKLKSTSSFNRLGEELIFKTTQEKGIFIDLLPTLTSIFTYKEIGVDIHSDFTDEKLNDFLTSNFNSNTSFKTILLLCEFLTSIGSKKLIANLLFDWINTEEQQLIINLEKLCENTKIKRFCSTEMLAQLIFSVLQIQQRNFSHIWKNSLLILSNTDYIFKTTIFNMKIELLNNKYPLLEYRHHIESRVQYYDCLIHLIASIMNKYNYEKYIDLLIQHPSTSWEQLLQAINTKFELLRNQNNTVDLVVEYPYPYNLTKIIELSNDNYKKLTKTVVKIGDELTDIIEGHTKFWTKIKSYLKKSKYF